MSIAEDFKTFLKNLGVDDSENISYKYGEITSSLNKYFRNTDSTVANSLQVGSYGRWTAIKGISDLDMLYIMPIKKWADYNVSGGQLKLLQDTKAAIMVRYPRTKLKVDRLVVTATYTNFHVEVQPVFEDNDCFRYPDTKNGGAWKITKPRQEIDEIIAADKRSNDNLRRLCRMIRSWRNQNGVVMGGLLIDTLVHKFMSQTIFFNDKSYLYYDYLSRDFFSYIKDLPQKDFYLALGSNQRVKVKKAFQRNAKKAYDLCLQAIDEEGTKSANETWRKLYGRSFPKAATVTASMEHLDPALRTEEFIEDKFPVDIRYGIKIECTVEQDGFRPAFLLEMLRNRLPLKARKNLDFHVADNDIVGPFELYWKVLNRGPVAEKRKCLRGQILADEGKQQRREVTSFRGDHVVECYAVQNGVVVARDKIRVPIVNNRDDEDE